MANENLAIVTACPACGTGRKCNCGKGTEKMTAASALMLALNHELQGLLAAVEFGYKQCERGHNLQMALHEARRVYRGSETGKKANPERPAK